MKVLVSRDDAWKLEGSMFIVEGSWETGYTFNNDVFMMEGVTTYYLEGTSYPVNAGFSPSTEKMDRALSLIAFAQEMLDSGDLVAANYWTKRALSWINLHNDVD
jgi:hypothetical protein